MTWDQLLALAGILAAACWTPGPNNAMLAASGATFGLRRTLPHVQGVVWGFPLMLFAVALGLGDLFRRAPLLQEALRYGGAALLVWMAWRIARAARPDGLAASARPLTFLEAAGFQWINPKAWLMCVAVIAQFVDGTAPVADALICAAAAAAIGATSSLGWSAFGAAMACALAEPRRLMAFNLAMAATILAGVAWLLAADL
jgi:threonine/homoserine/homoserine lactone efflux protein